MGLIVLGYGIVAAGFYSLIVRTAKNEPEFATAKARVNQSSPDVIDIAAVFDKKAA